MLVSNHTPLVAIAIAGNDVDRSECGTVIVKGTLALRGSELVLDAQQDALQGGDAHYDDDFATKACRYESDFVQLKPGGDFVVIGASYAPGGRPLPSWRCAASIGERRKELQLFGPRHWEWKLGGARMSDPAPASRVEVRYENAFGGQDLTDPERPTFEARNPIGRGFSSHGSKEALDGKQLPQIEDPTQLITSWEDRPAPQGLGFYGRAWQPRLKKAGTYDDRWVKTRHPYLPDDFQWAYQNSAHPDLISPRYFRGDERVVLENLTPEGRLELRLPGLRPAAFVQHGAARLPLPLNLDTVVVDAEARRVNLVWRAFFRAERPIAEYTHVDVLMEKS